MNYKKLISVTIALTVSVFTGSNVMAHGGGGGGHGGGGFGGGGFHGGGFGGRVIRGHKRAHDLPQDGKIGQQLLTTMGLS